MIIGSTAGEEAARRLRAELRTSYGNKQSMLNINRLRSRSHALPPLCSDAVGPTAALRRIASSFAHVSDVDCGSSAALPIDDSEDDAREELTEVLIRSEPFKAAVAAAAAASASSPAAGTTATATPAAAAAARFNAGSSAARSRRHHHHHSDYSASASPNAGADADAYAYAGADEYVGMTPRARALERWNQIACTVSSLFRVRRQREADPLTELRRLREQQELLDAFTRPFIRENGASAERRTPR